jgi:dTDP-4-amino-4,6-dideoxygalactose transaminase/nucleoside-diphosphate-sugar epimerase
MEGGILIGGSGIVGTAIAQALLAADRKVTVVDQRSPRRELLAAGAQWLEADLLTDDLPPLPEGEVVICLGTAGPPARWPWLVPVVSAVATARLLPALGGRAVSLLSSAEVYGSAGRPAAEGTPPALPLTPGQIDEWCDDATAMAAEPCPPWRSAGLGRRLAGAGLAGSAAGLAGSGAGLGGGLTSRQVHALAKLAQERLVARAADPGRLTILRLADVTGVGLECLITRLIRRALAGYPLRVPGVEHSFVPAGALAAIVASGLPGGVYNVGGEPVALPVLAAEIRDLCDSSAPVEPAEPGPGEQAVIADTSRLAAAGWRIGPLRPHLKAMVAAVRAAGGPVFEPALPVVIPPRAARPDVVAARQQASLWSGAVKHGNRWSGRLHDRLAQALGLREEHTLLVTVSGTSALRLVIAATAGAAAPGDVAVLPSFTFPATAEALLQLGYRLRFADVDEHTWTLDPGSLGAALAAGPARVVVCVDTFGNPCDYAALSRVCREAGVPLVADSAASIGSRYGGRPVAGCADGHAYSMSFAKVLSAGGAGGAAVLPADVAAAMLGHRSGWSRSELMDELHAIYALDQLDVLDDLVRRRNRIAGVYRDGLSHIPHLTAQRVRPGDTHSYVHWVARVPRRPALQQALADCGVQTKPYFRALHTAGFGDGERPGTEVPATEPPVTERPATGPPATERPATGLPVTERLDGEVLALPMSSELTEDDAEKVVLAVRHHLLVRGKGAW